MPLILALALLCQDSAARIEELVRRLGDESYAAREEATRELRKLGPAARDALRRAADSEDPEVRQRARALLEEAERPRGRAGSVRVATVNGDTAYAIAPGDGSPPITVRREAGGRVTLEVDGAEAAASETLERFLKDHAELAAKYGITADGIDYRGARVRFQAGASRAGGALLRAVDGATRAQLEIPEGGAVVAGVEPGSAAERLGLRRNDLLLELDGRKVASPEAAAGLLREEGTALVLRKGRREAIGPRRDF